MDQPVRITITFPTNAYFMSGIRDLMYTLIKNMTTFPEKWAHRFQSIVDELCNNAIEHGSAPLKEVKVFFLYDADEKSLEVSVEDSGTGKSKMKAADMQTLIDERRKPGFAFTEIRGRGLPKIVAEWTDELHFEDLPTGGLKISVKKYLANIEKQMKDAVDLQTSNDPTHIILTI